MTDEVKLKMPPAFDGKRDELNGWIQKCSLYFKFYETKFDQDDKKIAFALMLMNEGTAGQWASDFITQAEERNPITYGTWVGFKEALKTSFQDVDMAASARVLLRNLHQGKKTAEEYILEFKNVISRCGINEFNVIADFFYQGLNKPLREKIFALATMPADANALYAQTARLEQQWRLGQAYDRNPAKKPTFFPKRYSNHKEKDPDAMDVDRMTTEERDRHYKEGRCFTCHEIGHLSRHCPTRKNKGKQPARKMRMTETEEEAEEESDQDENTHTVTTARIRTALRGVTNPVERNSMVKDILEEGF